MPKMIDTLYPRKCRHLSDAQFHLRNAERSLEQAAGDAQHRQVHDMAQHLSGVCRRMRYAIDKTTRRRSN